MTISFRNWFFTLLAVCTISLLASCQSNEFTSADSASKMESAEYVVSQTSYQESKQSTSTEPTVQGLHIIKTGNMNLRVNELEKAKQDVLEIVKNHNGFTSAGNYHDYGYQKTQSLTIRVPSPKFESLMEVLSKLGYVENQSQNAQDVSEEFVDLEARLKTKREVEKRYVALLAEAKNIKDILEVEEKLRLIREEIEAKEGRLRYLKDRISLSTINLNLTQQLDNYSKPPKPSFFSSLTDNMEEGWNDFLSFVVVIMRLWVFWLVLVGIIFGIVRWRKSRK